MQLNPRLTQPASVETDGKRQVDLSRFVNSFNLYFTTQLWLCGTHFRKQNEALVVYPGFKSDAVLSAGENSRPCADEAFRLSGWICICVFGLKEADFSERGIVSCSPAWSRGFRDFEICFVEFISREQALFRTSAIATA